MHNVSHQQRSEHLSEVVKNALCVLVNPKCIAIGPSLPFLLTFCLIFSAGIIAAYYNISCECPSPGSQPMAYPPVRYDG